MPEKPLPVQMTQHVLSLYPHAVEQAGLFRKPGAPEWPDWCYLPMSAVYAIITSGAPVDAAFDMMEALSDSTITLSMLTAALVWRQTKTIYKFDADLSSELLDQPIDGNIPTDVLLHLPEWGMWVEAPGLAIEGMLCSGFFTWLEWDVNRKWAELRFLLCIGESNKKQRAIIPLCLVLRDGTLTQAVERLRKSSEAVAAEHGKKLGEFDTDTRDTYAGALVGPLNLVLYLCSTEPDIPGFRPAIKRLGNSTGPATPRIWDVGVRTGATIRSYRNEAALAETLDQDNDGRTTRAAPRPHIRRAHWHHYRTGEGRTEITIKWIAPMLVGGDEPEDMPTTIRRVK